MINPDWLRRVIVFGNADTVGRDAEELAAVLDDPAEVLPYLIVHARAFTDWPKARAALARAGANAAQPRARETDAERRDTPLSTYRAELYEMLRTTTVASDVHWQPDWEESGPHVETLLSLIKRVRFDEEHGSDSPSMFISRD